MTPMTDAVTAALLHSLWQGVGLALLVSITLFLLRNRSADARYTASVLALGILGLLPAITAWMLYVPATPAAAPATLTESLLGTSVPGATADPGVYRPSFGLGSFEAWVFPLWAVGVSVFSLRLLWASARVSRMGRRGRAVDREILERARSLARRMGVGRPFRVVDASIGEGPGVVGWLRPAILLPSSTVLGLTPEQLEAVIAHELAHIRRHDYLVNLLQMVVEAVLFFNPAVWWISNRIRHERELCCDDLAVAASGDALGYARALTQLEKLRLRTPEPAPGAAGGSLAYRIRRIVGHEAGRYTPSRLPAALALALALGCVLLNLGWAEGMAATVQSAPAQATIPAPTPFTAPELVPPPVPPAPAPTPRPAPLAVPPAPFAPGPPPAAPPTALPVPQPATSVPPAPFQATQTSGPWILYRGGQSFSDASETTPPLESLGGGDVLWFIHQGTAYVVRDAAILDETFGLVASSQNINRELERENRLLEEEAAALEARRATASVSTSAIREQIERLASGMDERATVDQLQQVQERMAAIQQSLARLQQESALERSARSVRMLSLRLTRAQNELQLRSLASRNQLRQLFETAVESGTAVPAP